MHGRASEIVSVGPRFYARNASRLGGSEEQQPRLGWYAHRGKYLENPNMPDAVDHEIIAGVKAARRENIPTECRRVIVDPHLTKVLQRLAVVGIAAQPDDFGPEIVAEAGTSPTKRFSDRLANRGLSAAYLAGETKQQAHVKSNAI
jgi:hypothetical protein